MKKQVTTSNIKSAHILSQGIISGDYIYVSGQVHANEDLELVGDTVAEKVKQIMFNIQTILEAASSKLDDIIKVVIYVTDMSFMPELNEVYPSYFTEPYPVREAVCVNALPLGASIEFSVIAAKSN
jgi:2-iminobutanoate/2-iminopropanoate deaminase